MDGGQSTPKKKVDKNNINEKFTALNIRFSQDMAFNENEDATVQLTAIPRTSEEEVTPGLRVDSNDEGHEREVCFRTAVSPKNMSPGRRSSISTISLRDQTFLKMVGNKNYNKHLGLSELTSDADHEHECEAEYLEPATDYWTSNRMGRFSLGYGTSTSSHIGVPPLSIRMPLGNSCLAILGTGLFFMAAFLIVIEGDRALPYAGALVVVGVISIAKDIYRYGEYYYFPYIEIREDGLWDNASLRDRPGFTPWRFGFGLIKWNDIGLIEIWSDSRGTTFISLTLNDVEDFKLHLNKDLQKEFGLHVSLPRMNSNKMRTPEINTQQAAEEDYHVSIPFVQEFDCDLLFAYGRIGQFVRLQRFKDLRIPSHTHY